jgi:hypothetical protein
MSVPLQSLPIFLQQSISSCVTVWFGIKHASPGTTAQISRTIRTDALSHHDIKEVYRGVWQLQILPFWTGNFVR